MSNVILQLVQKIESQLKAIGAEYKIILPSGDQFGGLDVRTKPKKVMGERILHIYKTQVETIGVGQVALIDVPDGVDVARVKSNIAAMMCNHYGKGSQQTYYNEKTKQVELLRLI
jgi:hypothetical protein